MKVINICKLSIIQQKFLNIYKLSINFRLGKETSDYIIWRTKDVEMCWILRWQQFKISVKFEDRFKIKLKPRTQLTVSKKFCDKKLSWGNFILAQLLVHRGPFFS